MLLALLLAQAAQAPAATPPAQEGGTVVVVGRRLQDTEKALADCLARRCPPKEDIDRSLAHAEAQLIAGDYRGSRRTLLAARGRNKRYAATLPVDVADLHRANARLAYLNGMLDSGRIGIFDIVDSLKAGLARDDERIMAARLEVGDAFAKAGRFEAALSHYAWVRRLARDGQMPLAEGMALFRRAALLSTMASVERGYESSAKKAVAEVMRSRDPVWAPFRNGLRAVPAVLVREKDRTAALATAIGSMEPQPADRPQLLYAPPIDLSGVGFGAAPGDDTQWADVGFRIARDGTVEDVRVTRRSERLQDSWLAAATRALHGRRYAPLALPPGEPGAARLERYSFVSDLVGDVGRIKVRSSTRRVEVLDLTAEPLRPR